MQPRTSPPQFGKPGKISQILQSQKSGTVVRKLHETKKVDHYKEAPDVPDEPDTQAGEAEAEDEE